MPIVESRTNFPTDNYWVSGAIDLVQSNQTININLNNLNMAIHYQAFDQPYTVGVEEDPKNTIKVGGNKMIYLHGDEMDLRLLGFNPKITEMYESIKFQFEAIMRTYNIVVDWAMSGDAASGFSLLVKNIDLLEARENQVELSQMEEQQVYKVIRAQQEVYKLDEPRLPDEKLIVDFHEITFPINQAEEQAKLEFEYKHNITTPVHTLASKEGLTIDEAKDRWQINKDINTEFSPGQQAFREQLNLIEGEGE